MFMYHFTILLAVWLILEVFSKQQDRIERNTRETRKLLEEEKRRREEEDENYF